MSTTGTTGGTWLSSSPNATVSPVGLVTGVTPGTATIFYFISNSCGSAFTSYNITVNLGASAGTISGRTCVRTARDRNKTKKLNGGNPGIMSWISEVAWRDFYKHVLANWPHVW